MRFGVLVLAAALAGCATAEVTPLGPDRFQATQATRLFPARGQGNVAKKARDFCAERGQRADLRLAEGRLSSVWESGLAVAEFTCVPR